MPKSRIAAGAVAALATGATIFVMMPHAQASTDKVSGVDVFYLKPTALRKLDDLGALSPLKKPTCSQRFSAYKDAKAAATRNRGASNFVHSRYHVPMTDSVLKVSYTLAADESRFAQSVYASMQQDACSEVPRLKPGITFAQGSLRAAVRASTCPGGLRRYAHTQRTAKAEAKALRTFRNTYHVPQRSKVDVNYAAHADFAAQEVTRQRDELKAAHCT